jgi:hypothetical protein
LLTATDGSCAAPAASAFEWHAARSEAESTATANDIPSTLAPGLRNSEEENDSIPDLLISCFMMVLEQP